MHDLTEGPARACQGCALAGDGAAGGRREFLATTARAIAAIALALTASPAGAEALVWRASLAGRRLGGQEVQYPVPDADGATVDRDNEVIVVRFEGAIYAFALSCPHQNTALRWEPERARFQCPKHHSKYRPDGTFIEGRATRGMDRYALRRDGDHVVADLATLLREDEDAAAWKAALVRVA